MVELQRSDVANPPAELSDQESNPGSVGTLHFEARSPKAAHRVEPEGQSVVVTQLGRSLGAATETTHVTRPRGLARWLSAKYWIISIENHWVFIAVGLSVVVLVFCAARLRGH
jgi:hypothetical protein